MKKQLKFLMILITAALTCLLLAACSSKKIDYKLEAGEALPSAAEIVGVPSAKWTTDVSAFDTREVGNHTLKASDGDKKYSVNLKIEDTTAPVGEVRNLSVAVGSVIPSAKDFFVNITDASEYTAEFAEKYIFTSRGEYSLSVVLSDVHGNKSNYNVKMNLISDKEAPTIIGPDDISMQVGGAVAYKKGFSVSDNCFGKLELEVDTSAVNTAVPGTYKVIYTATDEAGNVAKKEVTLWVHDLVITEDMLWEKIDETISKIIKDGMTKEEQCRAIYKYVSESMYYHPDSDKSDWVSEAYRGLYVAAGGDCFSFFAASKAFLTRLGIEHIDIQRLPGFDPATHFWQMVNIGTEDAPVWYYYDICPVRSDAYFHSGCLLTEQQIDAYNTARPHYYEHDKTNLPKTPDKIITPTPSLEEFYR